MKGERRRMIDSPWDSRGQKATVNLHIHVSLATRLIKFSDGFLFLTNCHCRLFPRWYFHKWKIILHCLNGTKESYYFPSDSIELTFRFTSKRVNKNRAAANTNWEMLPHSGNNVSPHRFHPLNNKREFTASRSKLFLDSP